MYREAGFTIIELLVVIVIIGLIATLSVTRPTTFVTASRDSERAEDTRAISRQLEQDYNNDLVNGIPGYPDPTRFSNDISSMISGTISGTNTAASLTAELVKAPQASSTSVVAATTNSKTNPAGAGTPTATQYVYQPLYADGTLCTSATSGNPCASYRLFYRQENSSKPTSYRYSYFPDNGSQTVIVASTHQQ